MDDTAEAWLDTELAGCALPTQIPLGASFRRSCLARNRTFAARRRHVE